MDFTFTEEQETIAKVARQLFEHRATPEHLTEVEAGDVRYDAALWRELATADLLGIALPENVGGSEHGFLELALLLAEVGWSVAPVPVYATLLLGADTIAPPRRRRPATAVPARRRDRQPIAHRRFGGTPPLGSHRACDHRPP
jgi:alkylation response protein AidB-like acyl-CoA dehydrogenase